MCVLNENNIPYKPKDKTSGKQYYFCHDDTIPNDRGECDSNKDLEGKCFFNNINNIFSSYDYLKVCGELTEKNSKALISEFGSVNDSIFVADVLACKSGFALYFFEDLNIKNTTEKPFYLACVTVKYVEKENDNCIIRYSLGDDKEYIYNKTDVSKVLYENNEFNKYDCNLIMIKIKLFKEYLDIFNKLKTHCLQGQFYNEPFTCENDELRKIWYYYNNPDHYLLYRNEEEIIDYFIQSNYPTIKSSNETGQENKENSNGFLNKCIIKYLLFLLLLLSL